MVSLAARRGRDFPPLLCQPMPASARGDMRRRRFIPLVGHLRWLRSHCLRCAMWSHRLVRVRGRPRNRIAMRGDLRLPRLFLTHKC